MASSTTPRLKDRRATESSRSRSSKGRRGRNPARLLVPRAEHALRTRRLPPGVRAVDGSRHRRPALDPRRPRCWPARPSWSASMTPTAPVRRDGRSNVWNTALLIGWDEPGRHVRPRRRPVRCRHPTRTPRPASSGFTFDRSGYRVPAILVSPWVEQGAVFNDEYRHTSLIATLRKVWSLGEPLTQRDASARTFDDLLSLEEPRDPQTWKNVAARPVPEWHLDEDALAAGLSGLGKSTGTRDHRTRPRTGSHTPTPARRPRRRDHADAHRRRAQKRRLALLSPPRTVAGRGREARRVRRRGNVSATSRGGGRYAWSARCSSV